MLSATVEGLIYRTGKPLESLGFHYVAALMWTPFFASLAARWVCHEGFKDISLRWGGNEGWRAAGLALLFPVLSGVLAYGFAWATGIATFQIQAERGGPAASSTLVDFLLLLLTNGGLGTVFGLSVALGEELGWRGYLLLRMRDAGIPRPILLGGLLWAVWHLPLIVTGQYVVGANIVLAIPMFTVGVLAASYFFGYLRLRSGSVWPAAIAHAAYNAIIQNVFDRSTAGKSLWVGEGGVVNIVVEIVLVVWVARRSIVALRAPEQRDGELRVAAL
ncbi:MAG: CPBP family intramembrane metalloprotease [Myxococcaceae bacterium]|nr:CPBP family intramembrane metalloprotease [Myxococcaceae bacterium]